MPPAPTPTPPAARPHPFELQACISIYGTLGFEFFPTPAPLEAAQLELPPKKKIQRLVTEEKKLKADHEVLYTIRREI